MSEKFPTPKREAALTEKHQEWEATAAAFADMYPAVEVVQDSQEKIAEKFEEFESICDQFERTHDMEALYAITELDPKTARLHPIREPARQDLTAIRNLENYLKTQEGVPKEMLERVRARYLYIDRAIGNLNNGILYHDRPDSKTL